MEAVLINHTNDPRRAWKIITLATADYVMTGDPTELETVCQLYRGVKEMSLPIKAAALVVFGEKFAAKVAKKVTYYTTALCVANMCELSAFKADYDKAVLMQRFNKFLGTIKEDKGKLVVTSLVPTENGLSSPANAYKVAYAPKVTTASNADFNAKKDAVLKALKAADLSRAEIETVLNKYLATIGGKVVF